MKHDPIKLLLSTANSRALFSRETILQCEAQLKALTGAVKSLERLLDAAEEFNSLYDDESRAKSYAAELKELSKAKDSARSALKTIQTSNQNLPVS